MEVSFLITNNSYPFSGIEEFLYETIEFMEGDIFWISFRSSLNLAYTSFSIKKCDYYYALSIPGRPNKANKFFISLIKFLEPRRIHYCAPGALEFLEIVPSSILTIFGIHFLEETPLEIIVREILRKNQRIYLVSKFLAEANNIWTEIPILNPILKLEKLDIQGGYITIINPYKGGSFYKKLLPLINDLPLKIICTRFSDLQISNKLSRTSMKKIWSRTSIFVFYTIFEESFSRVSYEAMIFGIPIVCSARGNLPHLLGEAAIYPGENPDDWEREIRHLFEEKRYHSFYAERIKERSKIASIDLSKNINIFKELCF